MGDGPPEQTPEARIGRPSRATLGRPDLDSSTVPPSFTGMPDGSKLVAMQFPNAAIVGSDGLPVKPASSLGAPSKTFPKSEAPGSEIARAARTEAIQPTTQRTAETKLTPAELGKAITDLGSTKPEVARAALLKLAKGIAGTDGANVIKALGNELENTNPEISKAAARLLSDTYWGILPSADVLSNLDSLRYSQGGSLKDVDPGSDLFARLSNPQILQAELGKIAELKSIMADQSKFDKIKQNASASWLDLPEDAVPGPNHSSRMQALYKLTKTNDFLHNIQAQTSEEFLAKNLELFRDGYTLNLRKFPITDNSLKEILKQKPDMDALLIGNGSGITDEGLKILKEFKRLTALHLDESKITDAGLATLGSMPELSILYLGRTPGITNQGISHLANTNLSYVGFSYTPQITKDAIPALQKLAGNGKLGLINLFHTGITVPEMQSAGINNRRTQVIVRDEDTYWDSQPRSRSRMLNNNWGNDFGGGIQPLHL